MYELLYIVPAPLTEKDLPNVIKKINDIIKETGGEVIEKKNLGNKKLAYPIKHIHRGFYILSFLEIEPSQIKELNKKLEFLPEILRHLITKPVKRKSQKNPRDEKSEETKKEKTNIKKLEKRIDDLFKI